MPFAVRSAGVGWLEGWAYVGDGMTLGPFANGPYIQTGEWAWDGSQECVGVAKLLFGSISFHLVPFPIVGTLVAAPSSSPSPRRDLCITTPPPSAVPSPDASHRPLPCRARWAGPRQPCGEHPRRSYAKVSRWRKDHAGGQGCEVPAFAVTTKNNVAIGGAMRNGQLSLVWGLGGTLGMA